MEDFEKYIKILNSERCLKNPKEAAVVLDKINSCFNQEKSKFTIGLLVGLLLDESSAIFTFIWKTSSDFETISATTGAFKLLEHIVTSFQSSAEPYFPILFEKCLFLLDRRLAKVKEVSLKLIKTLIISDAKQMLDLSRLISELERHSRDTKKIPGSVSEQIYELLGYMFEKHPESVKNKEWFLENICESLRFDCMVTKNPAIGRIKGAFEGINGYLTSYPPPNKETAMKIYEYIKKLSKFRQDKKMASRAGLKILQNHWIHFSDFIYNDKEFWRINLEVWTTQKKEDRVPAFQFLCTLYSVIALYAKQDSGNSEVSNYVQEFTETLKSDSSPYEKRTALVGIKLFVLTDAMKEPEFSRTYEAVLSFVKKHESYSGFAYFPLCIECVSAFVLKLSIENVSMEQLTYLQKLSGKLIETYPTLEPELQPDALTALEKSFYMLGLSNLQIMESHIGRVVHQGLIRTCSSITLAELELLKEMGQPHDCASYKSYLSLWKYLLTLAGSPNLPVNGSFSLKTGVASRVFDVFIESFLKIVSKLNLNVGPNMEVQQPSDLSIFINIIDLYRDLNPFMDPFLLQKWLTEIFKTIIHLSRKNPFVSGFYKIMEENLTRADNFQFFEDDSQEKQKSLELVATFLEDALPRIDQYKGDLQVACLKMILSAPVKVITNFAEKTVPVLEVAVHLARSSFSLLKDIIEALERWDLLLPPTTSSAIMTKILPHFDKFFQSTYFSGRSLVNTSIEGKKLKNNVVFSDSELLTVQKKFLMFLGQMDISKAANLIELRYTEKSNLNDRDLIYSLPFFEGSVEINLNEMMPRVMDLATSCINRRTRITACELLYSGVMVLLGNTKQLSGGYTVLFREMMKTCLILGCDSDGVICQIFEPLMYQIVRYFSGKETLNFSESNDLIDVLVDYVTRPCDPTLRDFSADLIKEFTVWSVKQLTPEELKVTPQSVSRILKNIYSLALHPSFNKRLGAAVVFNRIYSVLREEEFILNVYWFQLFYYFMESLRMCEGPGDVTEILEAIQHVKRPLMEKYAEFNKDSPERQVPPEFEGGRLCHLVKWTMERACDVKPFTRRIAMVVVQELAPLVENCDFAMSFASKKFRNFFLIGEKTFESSFSEENFIIWLNHQVAGFEYCTWLLEEKVLSTEEVLRPQFVGVIRGYIAGIMSRRGNAMSVELSQQESVLAFLKLLNALRERAYLFPPELWDFLKTILFSPTALGFRVNQTSIEQLSSLLTEVLRYLSTHLTAYDWNQFYRDLETVVSVPAFGRITRCREVDVSSSEFLFAFSVVEASGLWDSFREKMLFPSNENLFISPIFKSLFINRGRAVYAVALEPFCRLYLEEVLKIMLRVSKDLKGVLSYLENEEVVRAEETEKTVKKGEYFQFVFKNALFGFLSRNPDLLIERLLQQGTVRRVQLLIQIIESCEGDLNLPSAVLQRWQDFETMNMNDPVRKDKLLLQLAVSCAKAIGTPGFLKGSPVADNIYNILENEKFNEMDVSEGVFSLLPFLSDFAESENDRLSACLSRFQVDQNTLKGTPVKEGCIHNQSTLKLVFNGVLQSLRATASLVLLRFALRGARGLVKLCSKGDIESALKVFAEGAPLAHSVSAVKLAYSFCFDNGKGHSMSVVFESFLSPLMWLVPNTVVYQLVNENLESLCEIMTANWEREDQLGRIKANLVRKTCAAGIFKILVTKLTKQELDEMPRERRLLIDTVVKKVFSILKYPYPPKILQERYRKLMVEIFNMICCIISARCKEEKFYKLFIFDVRGSFLYGAIDGTVGYNFDMDFEELPKRKKLLTFLKETMPEKSQLRSARNSIKYIHTNTLFTSSLREDVTRFDLTYVPIRPMDSLPRETIRNVEIELEMDSLNSHECMPVLVATISKMVNDKITPDNDVTELPCWLKFFVAILTNPEFCENLKLFVLKAIYNVQGFAAPYCKQVFPVLVDAILELLKGHPLSYFLVDLIEMIISWMYLPEEKYQWQLTELLVLMLHKSDSFKRDIVKYNLEVLKRMVEAWKSALYLTDLSSAAFKLLSKSVENDSKLNGNGDGATYFSAHICGVLLANGIPAWKEDSEKKFFQLVLRNLHEDNKQKELFAEICALGLSHIEKTDPDKVDWLEKLVREKIFSLPACWLQVLYGMHKHYPKMSSFFTYKIFSSAWDLTDSLIVCKLELLLSHVSRTGGTEDPTFERHADSFLVDMLNSPDAAVQELSLQIANKLLDKFDDDKLTGILKEVGRLQKSTHSDVRKWVYEICVKLYGKNNQLKGHCSIILLRGLNDGLKELEDVCLRFWKGVLELSSVGQILLQILKIVYFPETEDIFLSNSAKVLLQFATDKRQLENPIFVHPITHQCRFQKRNLVLSSRQSLFKPTFSRTLANESVEHIATLRQQNLPYLRPTVGSLLFEPTAAPDNLEKVTPSGETSQSESSAVEVQIPSNPFKRRFYKSPTKTSFSFANWQKRKKKKEMEEEEDADRRAAMTLDIYGEYRHGNFPDIQLRHSQIVKLFEALAKSDQHFARQLLVSLFSGMIKMVKFQEKATLLSEVGKCFEEMLRCSENFDPGVFGFVLQLILKHSREMKIDCQLISNAAASSNWLSLGALIIEETIANSEDIWESSPKRRRGCDSSEEARWLELVRLYRSLEEFDVLSGIFQDKLNVQSDAREAIDRETLMDWFEASKRYESILRAEPESNQSEFYLEAYFSCLAKLSNWSFLNKCIRSTVDNDLDGLWKNYNLLSWFITSEMMISLGSDGSLGPKTLEEFCRHTAKRSILATNFGEELAAFDLLSNKFHTASYRIDRLCLDFLAGWSHLDRWSYNLRAAKLAGLQTLSELNFAVTNLAEVSKPELERSMKLAAKRWENNLPTPRDDLTIWDVKLGYRRQFLKRLKDVELTRTEVRSSLALVRAALQQDNLNLAREYLSRAKDRLPDGDATLRAEHDSCFDLGKIVVARQRMKDENVGMEMYLDVYRSISKRLLAAMETDFKLDMSFIYGCNFTLGQLVTEMLPSVKKQTISQAVLEAVRATLEVPEGTDIASALQSKGLECLEKAKAALEESDCPSAIKSNAYLELSKFLLKFPSFTNVSELEKLFEYTLRSIELGNPEARQLFGCLLNVSNRFDSSPSGDILPLCDRVPSWMFLAWTNQMLACLSWKIFPILKSILLRITQDYPNAIRYAVKLAEESPCMDAKTKSFLIRLNGILSKDRLYQHFWNAMKFLAPPESILRYHLEHMLQEASQDRPDHSQITKILSELKEIMFSNDYSKFRGPVFKVWEQVKEPLQDLLTDSEEKEVLIRKIKNLMLFADTLKTSFRKGLESYSPWLHNFHSLKADAPLELPGQYDGIRQPIKKYLVTITSFRNNVLTFTSKCRPVRITVLGNDATEHKFLVKFGEDVRQDERIQQVLRHFSYRLRDSKQTKAFFLDTYKVIPLTHNLGMIEWVEDTVSLHEMMESGLENGKEALARAQNAHLTFLSQGSFNGLVAAHLTAYEKLSREIAITNFRLRIQEFPGDLLKKAFLNLSTSPEHFAHLRKNFATSHAVMCITHWLVGVGDRHLQNILVSTRTGRAVGIDFGYAFGFATQFLTPPELVPFRLSPQIVALMHPLDESGWIKQTMIHCLRLFRRDPFKLLSVLQVFAQEPLMDWLNQARKSQLCKSDSPETWYPIEKLSLVERKLNGANPVTSFEADLRAGHTQSSYLNKYLEVLRGVRQDNVRARCGEDGLTEVEQVECLIDLATDAHVLAKTYVGWNPWL